MYDGLIKRLRDWPRVCAQYDGSVDQLHDESADAIEDLNKQIKNWEEALSKQNENWEEALKNALDFIPCWIPVSERLPETIHEYVLCCGEKGGQFVGWIGEGRIVSGKARAFQNGGTGRYITHWMPLPEPPKEET